MELSKEKLLDMYRVMQRIRRFELEASKSFSEGNIQGFVHLYLGEEAVATGVCANLEKEDYITSTHRGHGHIIAKGADTKLMMAELCGRETGYCNGKGGSMHIADTELGILGANGIVGGGFTIAAGGALTAKMKKTGAVAVCFFGDGASNEGTFHEALNIASTWKLPVVFVCENNLYGISCRQDRAMALTDISERAVAYNMPGISIDGNDVLEVYEATEQAVKRARNGEGPTLIECKTYRWHGHFEGEPGLYRPKEEVEEWLAKDPLAKFEEYLKESGIAKEDELEEIQEEIYDEIEAAVEFAVNSPFPKESSALEDVYTDIVEEERVI